MTRPPDPAPPDPAPPVAWVYGLLGLIPFAAGALGSGLGGRLGSVSLYALTIYGALILSFLGGARWGLEIGRKPVRAVVISAAMAPTVTAFLLLLMPASLAPWRFGGLAAAFAVQWVWDVRSPDTPRWYPQLRSVLTAGAVAALSLGAWKAR